MSPGRLALASVALLLTACQPSRSDDGRKARVEALLGAQPASKAPKPAPQSSAPAPAPAPKPARQRMWRAQGEPGQDRPLIASAEDARRIEGAEPLNPEFDRRKSIRSLLEDFPWGDDREGVWPGTGHPDPEPLKPISDAEMMRRARTRGYTADRHHALISVARRQLPGALDAIAQAQRHEEPAGIREAAIAALIEHGRREALPLMWKGMADPNEFVRGNAVWAIALYGHAESLKAIRTALDDPHSYVVGMGILATTALRDEADFWPILERVVVSPDMLVYQEASYVLAQVDSEHARDLLRREYDRSSGERRSNFRWYLRENLRRRVY